MLNIILHHVGMLWIICSNKKKKYEMVKINHQDWWNIATWYNTYICSRFHGSLFEDFITHTGTNRCNLLCSIVPYDKKLPFYEDDEISIVDRLIPKITTTEALESLGSTFNFIEILIKLLENNFDARGISHSTAMK